jgi:nucleoside-diphosphate-sugar epimerase
MYGKPRLLITGANGFIGQHLVTAFANRGHRVVVAARRPMMFGPSVKQELIKDLAEGVDWMPLLQGIDVVIHLAALVHQGKDVDEALFDKISRQATAPCDCEDRRKTDICVFNRGAIGPIIRCGLDRK